MGERHTAALNTPWGGAVTVTVAKTRNPSISGRFHAVAETHKSAAHDSM